MLLAKSHVSAAIAAPLDEIDLTTWIFTLRDDEYRACSQAHIACGSTHAPDGRRMSINVERIAGNLMVQHYVEQLAQRAHVKLHSITDSFSELGDAQLEIEWEFSVAELGNGHCEFTNQVVVSSTASYLQALERAGIRDLDAVKARTAAHLEAHNREETPLFAANIQDKARRNLYRVRS